MWSWLKCAQYTSATDYVIDRQKTTQQQIWFIISFQFLLFQPLKRENELLFEILNLHQEKHLEDNFF